MPGNDPPPDLVLLGVPGSAPMECRRVEKITVSLSAEASTADRAVMEAELAALLSVEVSVVLASG